MNMHNRKKTAGAIAHLLLTTFLLLVASACASPTPLPDPLTAPLLTPGGEITISPNEKIDVQASATGATRYEWTIQGDGQLSSETGEIVIYTAPDEGGLSLLTVTASNGENASAPASLVIHVARPEIIRLDALAIPAGFMSGEGAPESFIQISKPDSCQTGADCLQFDYQAGGTWGGIYWWPLGCGKTGDAAAWGLVRNGSCGVNLLQAGNFSSLSQLTFFARGERGGEVVEFKVGAIDVAPSPGRSLGKVNLTAGWESYSIDLTGMDLENAIGLFAWIATDLDNPNGATFYLEDIQYEGLKENN